MYRRQSSNRGLAFKDWVRISRDHTVSTFVSAVIVHQVSAFLRPMLVWVISKCRKLRKHVAYAKRLLALRVREVEQRVKNGSERPATADAFTWLIDVAKGRPINFVLAQLNLSEASIHKTSAGCSNNNSMLQDIRRDKRLT